MALTDEQKSGLYAIGFNVGGQMPPDFQFLDEEGINALLTGVKENLLKKEPKVPLDKFVPKGAQYLDGKRKVVGDGQISAGIAALQAAAKAPGAKQTDTGLVYLEVAAGKGEVPKEEDTVTVHYEGKLLDGTIFDSSYERGEPIKFSLKQVIPGWTEGLQLMKKGGKARLTIPPDIAYGAQGAPPAIPPMATLIFDVELLDFKPPGPLEKLAMTG